MRTFCACLWKEWREQRGLLALLAGAITVMAAIAVLGFERHLVVREGFLPMVASAALVIAAIATSARLIGQELTGVGLDLLRRLPAGLAAPFVAKLVVYALAILVVPAWAALATLALRAWWIGPSSCDAFSLAERWELLLPFGLLAITLFAVSTWVPRSGWAPPASLLVVGLWLGPALVAAQIYPELEPRLARLQLATPLMVLPLLVGAAWSFIAGYRLGFTPSRALSRGLIVSAVIAAPVWGWTGATVTRWVRLAPTDADAQITSGFVGAGGRFAFLTYANAGEKLSGQQGHAIRVDLTTGDWREMGGYAHRFENAGGMDRSTWLAGSSAPPELLLLEDVRQHRYDLVDARSGEIFQLALDQVRDRVRASKRITSPLRIGGRRAWFQDGTLECDDGSGGWNVASALAARIVSWAEGPEPPGLAALEQDQPDVRRPRRPVRGPVLFRQSGGDIEVVPLDLFRGRTIEKQDLGEGWAFEAALECGWLVRPTLEPHHGEPSPPRPWFLQDPVSGTRVPLVALEADEWLFAVHDDNHVWTISEQDQKRHRGRLFLVDVPNGTREEIPCAGIYRDDFMRIENPGWPMAPAYTPAGSRVYAICSSPDLYRLARFDERKRELVPALAVGDLDLPTSFLALPDEDSAILARGKHTIVRVHFGSEECEILFPREP